MMITYTDMNRVITKFNALNSAITNANSSLQNVLTLGESLLTDTAYAQTFGTSPHFTAWTGQAGTAINTFVANWPVQPVVIFNWPA